MSNDMLQARRLPIGAELTNDVANFRLWAPCADEVSVTFEKSNHRIKLNNDGNGYFSGVADKQGHGILYRLALGQNELFPDPASRFQPTGPHGPSMLVDSSRFNWTDQNWQGIALSDQVIYEMHIGTFTLEGTWQSATSRLPHLKDLGVNCIEVMPVADFPGNFNWGYDGVNLFSPSRIYGTPDDFRAFVNFAHALDIAVILDVVYNHVGPDGNYLRRFSADYFSDRYDNEWGKALNFDGENSGPVREFFTSNAVYWITEFHLDGLRLDATQQIFDNSPQHILTEIGLACRRAAPERILTFICENESQHAVLVQPVENGGMGLDGIWNDDFHHSASVALTGKNEAYYTDYTGKSGEFLSCAKWGFLYQGQRYSWQKKRRGTPTLGISSERFISFLENHDQIANSGQGQRLHQRSAPSQMRAMTAVMFLSPATPMLFQGQEYGSSKPFLYFADHNSELSPLVREGRLKFLSQFPSMAGSEIQALIPDPSHEKTFLKCKLNYDEYEKNSSIFNFHKDLIRVRRTDPVISSKAKYDGAVLSDQAFVLRYFSFEHGDRLIIFNLGTDLHYNPAPEPLLAPPIESLWQIAWSSEEPAYGGNGVSELDTEDNWRIPAGSATLLIPKSSLKSTQTIRDRDG